MKDLIKRIHLLPILLLSLCCMTLGACGSDDDEEEDGDGSPSITMHVERLRGNGGRTYRVEAFVSNLEASEIARIGCLVSANNSLIGSGTLSTGYSTSGSAEITITPYNSYGIATFRVIVSTIYGQVLEKSLPIRY